MRINYVNASVLKVLSILALSAWPASALIIAGAHGGSDIEANTTSAGMTATTGAPSQLFDRVAPYKTGGQVYLGYNASTGMLWTITAAHLFDSTAPLVLGGNSYAFNSYSTIPGTDIWLNSYVYTGGALNNVPALNIRSTALSTAAGGSQVIMTGYGYGRNEIGATANNVSDAVNVGGTNTGYTWSGDPGTKVLRWGLNNVSAVNQTISGYNTGNFFSVTFNAPTNNYLNSNEASFSVGDSGGGVFALNGSTWELAGINSQVGAGLLQNANTTAFNNPSYLVELSDNRTNIYNITGNLVQAIPEAGSTALLSTGLLLTALRRKRD